MNDQMLIQNPYSIDPTSFIQGAVNPMQGGMPQMPQMTPASYNAQSFYGPTHAALAQAFQSALQQQLGVPGLLSQMQSNPAIAQQIGGLLSTGNYTPKAVEPYILDWKKAEEESKKKTSTPAESESRNMGYLGYNESAGEGSAGSGSF